MNAPSVDAPVQRPTQRATVQRWTPAGPAADDDVVAREEPLEVLVRVGAMERRLGLLLRTPGEDAALAVGLLFAEGIVESPGDVERVSFAPSGEEHQEFNSVRVDLAMSVHVDWDTVSRPLVMTAACGVCGRAMLSGLHRHAKPGRPGFQVSARTLVALPDALRKEQDVFERTGGLHAAALFGPDGALELLREDVGRHNAVDKLVGTMFNAGRLPLGDRLLLVSGRAGYEIVQKAVRAGIPLVAAVGAPSSLAVDTAKEFGVTLVGFLREGRFNVYSSPGRVVP